MTQGTRVVDYATPLPARRRDGLGAALVCVIAIAAGFLGASRFADEVGFPPITDFSGPGPALARVLSGVIVSVFVLVLGIVIKRQGMTLAHSLRSAEGKLSTSIAITLLICGTLCLILSLFLPLYFGRANEAAAIGMHFSANGAVMSVGSNAPLLVDLLAVLIFLAGAGLALIGVWGSLRPATGSVHLGSALPDVA